MSKTIIDNSVRDLLKDKNSVLRRRLTLNHLKTALWVVIRFVLLLGLCFIILYPFIVKFSSVFMSVADTYDDTVSLIPRNPTLDNIKYLFEETELLPAMSNTFIVSIIVAVLSVISSSLIGYGLAKFRFRGKNLVFILVVLTLVIPMSSISIPMFIHYRYFDVLSIFKVLIGHPVNLIDTYFPNAILAATSLGFRGGLYVIMMRQCFIGIPYELNEAASVDGAGTFRTFYQVNLPLAKGMAFVVFLLSFCWQWTDIAYATRLMTTVELLPSVLNSIRNALSTSLGVGAYVNSLLANAFTLIAILPLIILYLIFQRQLIQGVERSGIVE